MLFLSESSLMPTNTTKLVVNLYHNESDTMVKAFIKQFLPENIRKKKHWEDVLEELKTDIPMSTSIFNNDENIINFQNGILDLRTGELHPHDPKIMSTIQIPCDYIPDATLEQAPVFKQYLNDLLLDDYETMNFILEYIGAVISNIKGSRFKKMLLMTGCGNTGKTQLREFVIKLLGESNCMTIDLKNLNEKFGTSSIVNKRLVGCGDMSYARIDELNVLKELTGGDDVYSQYKYGSSFSFKYKGFLWFNCNDVPLFGGDTGKHVYERFIVIPCNNVIPEEKRDPFLLDKMLQEKAIIASVCIPYLQRVIARGYRFTESETIDIERYQYEIKNDSLLSFLDSCCRIGRGKTRRTDFKVEYIKWCEFNGYRPVKKNEIYRLLSEKRKINSYKSNGDYYYELEFTDEYIQERSEIDLRLKYKNY